MTRRILLAAILLVCPAIAQAQHLVDGVNLADTIKITDDSVPGFAPVTMTWNAASGRWSSAAGLSPVYHFHRWDDENGEQYVVGVDHAGIGYLDAASKIVSKPGTKPLVFYKKIPDFPIAYYWAFIRGDAVLPLTPLPLSTYTVQ